MRLNELCALLVAYSLGSITGVISVAVPDDHSGYRLEKRQSDITPESEAGTTGTGKLRTCKSITSASYNNGISTSICRVISSQLINRHCSSR